MRGFARNDTSVLGRWWWTVDRWIIAAVVAIIAFGVMLTLAASPSVADRLGFDSYYFVRRQFAFLPFAVAVMFGVSLMSPRGIRRLAVAGFGVALVLMVATIVFGLEIKGAQRWIEVAGLSLQPSELVKPTFAVVAAWLFAATRDGAGVPGNQLAMAFYAMVVALLLMQPDVGMAVVVSAAWFTQFFLAGLPLLWVAFGVVTGLAALVSTYFLLPHVASRIDRFLDPAVGDSYQIKRSLDAFVNGGAWGRGPGEGEFKTVLPDAHTDFIFAVAGEEFGLIVCLFLAGLFAFVVLRGFSRLFQENDLFILLAAGGLLVMFGLQALINICVNLDLLPNKGMTLPFVSYGGSSLLALAAAIGMVLAMTRTRAGASAPRGWR